MSINDIEVDYEQSWEADRYVGLQTRKYKC